MPYLDIRKSRIFLKVSRYGFGVRGCDVIKNSPVHYGKLLFQQKTKARTDDFWGDIDCHMYKDPGSTFCAVL